MKKGCWIALAVGAFIGLVCSCGGILVWRGWVTIISGISSDRYALVAEGDRLYVQSNSEMTNTFDVVEGKPYANPITLPLPTDANTKIVIDDGKGPVASKAAPQAFYSTWSDINQAAYWVTFDKSKTNNLWRWTRKDGFRILMQSRDTLEYPSESLDGKFLCVKVAVYDESAEEYSYSLATFSTDSLEKKVFKVDDEFFDSVMLAKGKFFISGDRDYMWEPERNRKTDLNINGSLEWCLGFKGRVWGIRRQAGKFDVVRLDETATKVDQSIPFPPAFLEREKASKKED